LSRSLTDADPMRFARRPRAPAPRPRDPPPRRSVL